MAWSRWRERRGEERRGEITGMKEQPNISEL
jgi:hypothetical protein